MRQIDTIRRYSKDFDAALDAARKKYSASAPAANRGGGGLEVFETAEPDEALEVLRGTRGVESLGAAEGFAAFGALEAIILDEMRPPYLILEDEIEIRGDYDHVDLIRTRKAELEAVARSVGRVDLFNHWNLSYAGTGWLVAEDVAVTNRHVASIFARKDWSGNYVFQSGTFNETMEARLDYVRQHDGGSIRRRADVLEVLYIAGPREPDIAFLKVAVRDDITPLELVTSRVEDETPVAAVGYPASDGGRNDPTLMKDLFQDIYDVKRFSPGLITGHESDGVIVTGDYTSLGGNSGSPVLELETGKAVGLHFAGAFRDSNYAVASDIVASALASLGTTVTVDADLAVEAPTSKPDAFAGRGGYDVNFLGDGDLSVPWPELGSWSDDVAPVADDDGDILKYGHYSVIQSKSRRLPLVTAVNIDGEKAFRLKRKGTWKLDGRIALEHQVGNELYKHNPLDRGHMVRRMDPGWGATREEAQQAEIDTFHYTNSVPQHEDLNQKDWVGLEDYVLESAETRDFKVSVFTGPVFRDDDRRLKVQEGAEDIPIPEEFWKIAVMVNADTGELSATGYILSHGKMIRDMVEAAFVLGKYETYQVRISKIEEETGLDFGVLRNFDPMNTDPGTESLFGESAKRIGGAGDLQLR